MINQIVQIGWVALACATFSVTLTKSSLFSQMRYGIRMRSSFFGKLFHCPYCMLHWACIIAMVIHPWKMVPDMQVVPGFLFALFALIGLSAIFAGIIMKLIPFAYISKGREDELVGALKTASNKIKELRATNKVKQSFRNAAGSR